METTVTIDIKARPQRVWQVMTDVRHWPEWTESTTSVELEAATLEVGESAVIKQPKVPAATWTVTHMQPEHSFIWESHALGIDSVAVHEVQDIGPFGTNVTLTVRQTGPLTYLMRPWLASLTRRYVEMEAVGLKRRCEDKVPAGPRLALAAS